MLYIAILFDMLLGLCLAVIGAHPRFCNLDLAKSAKIGLSAGLFGSILYVLSSLAAPGMDDLSFAGSALGVVIAGAAIVLWHFFRDPNRTPPQGEDLVVSPADGRIIYIREVKKGVIPCAIKGKKHIRLSEIAKTDLLDNADGYIVGISMNILDVHVTRAPVDGTVIQASDIPGKTLSPKTWRAEIENPRTTLVIRNGNIRMGLIEIGTPFVSRVITLVKSNAGVRKGDRIGKITWGSQFDVIIPTGDAEILAMEGDRVCAGETVLARLKPAAGQEQVPGERQ